MYLPLIEMVISIMTNLKGALALFIAEEEHFSQNTATDNTWIMVAIKILFYCQQNLLMRQADKCMKVHVATSLALRSIFEHVVLFGC